MQVIETKSCKKCCNALPLDSFYLYKNKGQNPSYRSVCKSCYAIDVSKYQKENAEKNRLKAKRWRENNPEKHKTVWTAYRERNKEVMRQRCADWRKNNLEYANECSSRWAKENPEKAAANAAKRRAQVFSATPAWADKEAIKIEYALAKWCSSVMGEKYHVDHIIPLKGKNVCGLHVHQNLQVIPASVNQSKRNSFKEL